MGRSELLHSACLCLAAVLARNLVTTKEKARSAYSRRRIPTARSNFPRMRAIARKLAAGQVTAAVPLGQWTDLNGQPHQMAQHNCWTDAVWFFPALSMLSDYTDPTIVYNDLGPEQYNGHNVRAHSSLQVDSTNTPVLALLSTVDYYLDSQTAIPIAMAFATHADSDLNLGHSRGTCVFAVSSSRRNCNSISSQQNA